MAKYEFDKNKFEEWKKAQQESAALQEKLNSSVKNYLTAVKELGELQKNILHIEKQINKLKKEQGDLEGNKKKNEIEIARLRRAGVSLSSDEIKNLRTQNKELKTLIAAKKQSIAITEAELGYIKKQTEELTKQVASVNKISMGFKGVVSSLMLTPGLIKKGFGMLKGTGIFEMDKEIRNAVRSMAGGKSTYNMMYGSITKAAESTTMWGVGVKDLAIMQRGYSEAIGRSVMLTEDGYKAMAKLAEGTGLGKEFAVEMAGAMDNFNVSAERTSSIVEDTMNLAAKMGVNGAAAVKSLQKNLALAQRFNFKGGIEGLAKLATEAVKLKLDMEGIAGMAEKVFRPEGAIEMAAQLTTMGGNFSALGDPMQLMFKARNNMAEFSKDIGKASAEFVEFNKENGEFQIKNGLAADRMREIATITGLSVEKLQEMAAAEARIQEIRKSTSGRFSKDDVEAIESMSKFDKNKGQWVVNINGQDKLVKDLRATDLDRIRKEQETLDKRAEEARTFDEVLTDLILQFKQLLLPFAKDLKEFLGEPLQKLSKEWSANGFYESLRGFVSSVTGLIPLIVDFVKNNPITAALIGGVALFGGILGKAALWFANGVSLGLGFRSVAGGGGGMPGKSGGNGGAGGFGARLFGQTGGPSFGNAARSVGGISAGLLSAGIYGYNEYSENDAMGMGTGENLGRTFSKGASAGAGGWGGAAAGAAIGTAILPGIGTLLGGLVGALAGSKLGGYVGEGIGDAFFGSEIDRRVAQNSYGDINVGNIRGVNDGVMFHENDKFIKVNDAMTIAGTSTSGNGKLAQELSKNSMPSEINHKFDNMNMTVNVKAPSGMEFWNTLFNDPTLMRELTNKVHKTTEETASGGKITGSGPKNKRTR
jgi:hypothetical protein